MKHTPGPWQAVTFSDEHSPCIIDREGDGRIAELTGNQTDEQTDANASLIAAAPELLEALRRCIECLNGPVSDLMTGDALAAAGVYGALIQAGAAIAKAEGRE